MKRRGAIEDIAAIADKFWPHITRHTDTGCWEYAIRESSGYGVVRVGRIQELAHRLSWRLHFGAIPIGLFVCHRCDNPSCVNPAHLFLGSARDNNLDRQSKGRSKNLFTSDDLHPARVRRGERHWCAKLSADDVRAIRTRVASGETQVAVGTAFGVTAPTVSRIVRHVWRAEVA